MSVQRTESAHPADAGGSLADRTDLEETWHRHGAAVFALALMLCDDVHEAEVVAVQAVLDACTPADLALARANRPELARYVYVLALRRRTERERVGPSGRTAETPAGSVVAECAGLSAGQRTAIALGLFGEHSCSEIGVLMGLPSLAVAALMRSGLLKAHRAR